MKVRILSITIMLLLASVTINIAQAQDNACPYSPRVIRSLYDELVQAQRKLLNYPCNIYAQLGLSEAEYKVKMVIGTDGCEHFIPALQTALNNGRSVKQYSEAQSKRLQEALKGLADIAFDD